MSINTIYDGVVLSCVLMPEWDSQTLVLIIDDYASPASQAPAQVVNINFGFVARIP